MKKLTKTQRQALIAARDLGNAWAYRAADGSLESYPGTASKARMIFVMRIAGLLDSYNKITEAGREALAA